MQELHEESELANLSSVLLKQELTWKNSSNLQHELHFDRVVDFDAVEAVDAVDADVCCCKMRSFHEHKLPAVTGWM